MTAAVLTSSISCGVTSSSSSSAWLSLLCVCEGATIMYSVGTEVGAVS